MKSKHSYLLAVTISVIGIGLALTDVAGGGRLIILGTLWLTIAEIQTIKERMR